MSKEIERIPNEIATLRDISFPPEFGITEIYRGKVAIVYELPDGNRMFIRTNNFSASDKVFKEEIPLKGRVVTEMSQFFFEKTKHIAPNHIIAVIDPNITIGIPCAVFPIEVVVRAVMKGTTSTSIWPRYQQGERYMYGIHFRDGYQYGDRLDELSITPTTKNHNGHDMELTEKQIIEGETRATPRDWEEIREMALGVARFMQQYCEERGVLFVDMKMEFGITRDGKIVIIDELGTPDSMGIWIVKDGKINIMDKEEYRIYLKEEMGWKGDSDPPKLPKQLIKQISNTYVKSCEVLTGHKIPRRENIKERKEQMIQRVGKHVGFLK